MITKGSVKVTKIVTVIAMGLVIGLAGCSASTERFVAFDRVGGNFDMRVVGSYGQEAGPPFTLNAEGTLPTEGATVPLRAQLHSSAVLGDTTVRVSEVEGDVTIEVIASGIQNGGGLEVKTNTECIRVGEQESDPNDRCDE